MVGCVQTVVGDKKILVKFEYGQNKDINSCLPVFLCLKEEVQMDVPISNSPKKEQGKLLIIDGNPEVGESCMFKRALYLSVFYCLCYVKDAPTDMLEEQVSEERYRDLNEE